MDTYSAELSFSMAGLNNQKFALLGLCLLAKAGEGRVLLPKYIVDLNSSDVNASKYIAFDAVFDHQDFKEFLKRWDLFGDDQSRDELLILPWKKCFSRGANALRRIRDKNNRDVFVCDFFKSLKANNEIKKKASEFLSFTGDDVLGLQLRIEKDWHVHIDRKLYKGEVGFRHYTLQDILTKIVNNKIIGCRYKKILACCDIRSLELPPQELKFIAKEQFGIDLFFREIDTNSFFNSGNIKNAMLDFEICLNLESYVGLSHSTFSNLLCVTKSAITEFHAHPDHYIYNSSDDFVKKRYDFGTHSEPEKAIEYLSVT